MHKLKIESLTVSSFEAAPAFVDLLDLSEPTHPRCSVGATGCEYCSPHQTQ
jgi:hypothetical protein